MKQTKHDIKLRLSSKLPFLQFCEISDFFVRIRPIRFARTIAESVQVSKLAQIFYISRFWTVYALDRKRVQTCINHC